MLHRDINEITNAKMEVFLEQKVAFLLPEHHSPVFVRDEDDQLICEEYDLNPFKLSYKLVLRKIFGIKI